jgi:hypothetical protein
MSESKTRNYAGAHSRCVLASVISDAGTNINGSSMHLCSMFRHVVYLHPDGSCGCLLLLCVFAMAWCPPHLAQQPLQQYF